MRILLLSVLCLLSFQSLNAQVKTNEQARETSHVLQQLNEQWKSDSLGLLGYRFKHFEALSKSKPDSISTDQLLKYLGRPNITRKSTYGNPRRDHVEYLYFILNDDPDGKFPSFGGLYLSFVFDAEENYLEEISEGEFCG